MKLTCVHGQPSWRLRNRTVDAWLTRTGGQLAPATFRVGGHSVQPFSMAPWAEEKFPAGIPPLLRALRGDFFCCPFGNNDEAWRGERHPPHGETANRDWRLVSSGRTGDAVVLHTRLALRVRPGRVDKRLMLRDGHAAVYCENVLSGLRGPVAIGTHPCLRFPEKPAAGRISTGGFRFGQVLPVPFERPELGGYSSLKTGARFHSLRRVPLAAGGLADLGAFPARPGFEDLVMLVGDGRGGFAWSAVTYPESGYVFFSLKDPRVLRHTVLWFSNGGRHYPPWNGRHRRVVGLEEVTAYFHLGLAPSARPNPLSRAGVPTCLQLQPDRPLRVAHIFAVAAIPRGFDEVKKISPARDGVTLTARSGREVFAPLDPGFLRPPVQSSR
ncbi:MAG TPA: hypothetical protein VMI53_11620 [Opitutaceae bacterium]|nr:hypothetical protein [Opitutaceae bacterium]